MFGWRGEVGGRCVPGSLCWIFPILMLLPLQEVTRSCLKQDAFVAELWHHRKKIHVRHAYTEQASSQLNFNLDDGEHLDVEAMGSDRLANELNEAASAGDVESAMSIFARAFPQKRRRAMHPDKMRFYYNIVLKSMAVSGRLAEAERWYEEMMKNNIPVNRNTFGKLMKAARKGMVTEGVERWSAELDKAFGSESVAYTERLAAAAGSARNRDQSAATEAISIFNEMVMKGVTPTATHWGLLLSTLCQSSQKKRLVELRRRMLEEVPILEAEHYAVLVRTLVYEKRFDTAVSLLRLMHMREFAFEEELLASVASIPARLGNKHDLQGMLSQAEAWETELGDTFYGSIMHVLLREGHAALAEEWYSQAVESSIELGPFLMSARLVLQLANSSGMDGCIEELLTDVHTRFSGMETQRMYSTLLSHLQQQGRGNEVGDYLEHMTYHSVPPLVNHYVVAIHAATSSASAQSWFDQLTLEFIPPQKAFAGLIQAYLREGQPHTALQKMADMHQIHRKPSQEMWKVLTAGLARLGRVDDVDQWLGVLKASGVKVGQEVHDGIALGFLDVGKMNDMREWLGRLRKRDIALSETTYMQIMKMCIDREQPWASSGWMEELSAAGEPGAAPPERALAMLIKAHADKGEVAEAMRLLHKMHDLGMHPNPMLDFSIASALIDRSRMRDARRWLDGMTARGIEVPDSLRRSMLDRWARHGNYTQAETYFRRNVERGAALV